jgi:hypothetical protein
MTQPDKVSDEMLMALADDELTAQDAKILHARINADPDLAARYADFVETRALMQAAYPPEPVPARLIQAVLQGDASRANVVTLRKRAQALPSWAMAMAASLVLAVGGFWAGQQSNPDLGGPVNLGAITSGLPTGGDVQLPDGSRARVLASYDTSLGLCRMIGHDRMRHVTCRDASTRTWAVALSVPDQDAASFLPAADIGVELIDRLLDDIEAGPALTGEEERNILSR